MIGRIPAIALLVLTVAMPAPAAAQADVFTGCSARDVRFAEMDRRVDGTLILRGVENSPVVVVCDDTRLSADEIEAGGDELVHARGNVLIEQPDMRVTADRADLHRQTRFGSLFEARGFLKVTEQAVERDMFGTQESDFEFRADRIDKIGPRSFRLTGAWFTACAQPAPRWHFTGSSGTLALDEYVLLRNVVLRVKNVPVFYLPILYYPIDEDGRSTGFLMPSYGTSTIRGASISNAFFWAIGRSQDATFFHDWFSQAGQGAGAEYRYTTAPGSEGHLRLYLLDEKARLAEDGASLLQPAKRSYDVRANVNQALWRGFRAVGRVNYFSDVTTQQTFHQDVFDFSQRQRDVAITVLGQVGRYRISADTQQRDIFYGTDARRQGRLPRFNVTAADKPIGRSLVYLGGFADATYLVRQDDLDDPATDQSLWRLDAQPRVRLPLSKLPYLTATTSASWRVTRWFESVDEETGAQVAAPVTRHLLDFRVNAVGPVFARVFQTPDNGYAERFKHLVEPFVSLQWLSPFDGRHRVVQIDGVDTLVGGTAQVTYGITNRLLARRPNGVRDILSVGIRQTYYSDLRAAAFDSDYDSAAANPFSPIRINVDVRPTDGLTGKFTTEIDSDLKKPRTYNAGATLRGPRVELTASWAKRQFIPELPGFDDPARASHYANASTTVRLADNRVGGTYAFNLDILNRTLVQQRVVAYYNAQCCGIAFDYQEVNTANLGFFQVPADRRFGISFTLAGIGAFANPLGSFGR